MDLDNLPLPRTRRKMQNRKMQNTKLFEDLAIDKMVLRSTGAKIAETQGGVGGFKILKFSRSLF